MPLDIGILKMELTKNSKKSKMNGIRKDQEKLLISYSGEEKISESDSDRVQPLELPPTRLRRPKSRKIRVSTSSKSMFSMWKFCQVVFVVVVLGSMVSMIWFTIILKTSLESMKKRVSILETSDRSTSKECLKLGKDLEKKIEVMRGSSASLLEKDEKSIHLLFKRIKVLNATVKYLQSKLKSPKSVLSMKHDIELLKKAMADTNGEMAEVTDKVNRLRKIAHLENDNIKHLKIQMYNVSVQIAKLSGQPTPSPQTNTATPPWLLRVPAADISSNDKTALHTEEAEKLRGNITSLVRKDMNKLASFVRRANKTVQNQLHEMNVKLSRLVINVSGHMALIDHLKKQMAQHNNDTSSRQTPEVASIPADVLLQYNNLTQIVGNLGNSFNKHFERLQEMTSDIASINVTVNHLAAPSTTSCNCSLGVVWTAMSKDQKMIRSLKSDLELLQDSVQKLSTKDMEPTKASILTPKDEMVKSTTESISSTVTRTTPSQQPTTVHKNVSGTTSILPAQASDSDSTVAPTSEQVLKQNRRMSEDEQTDLDSWPAGDDTLQDSIFKDNTDK